MELTIQSYVNNLLEAPLPASDPVERMRQFATQELERIGLELKVVGVFMRLPPFDLAKAIFFPGQVTLQPADGDVDKMERELAEALDQTKLAGTFFVDGIFVRVEAPRELR